MPFCWSGFNDLMAGNCTLFAADCDGFNFTSESPAGLPASRSPDLVKSLVFLSVTEAVWSAWLAIVTLMLVLGLWEVVTGVS